MHRTMKNKIIDPIWLIIGATGLTVWSAATGPTVLTVAAAVVTAAAAAVYATAVVVAWRRAQ